MHAVIVSYNSAQDLQGFFEVESEVRAFDEVIVVDNGSSDGSPDVAAASGAQVIEQTNVGFGRAANVGAEATTGPAFMLLNPDIRVDEQSVPAALASHLSEDVGLVAPALRLPDGSLQDSARTVPTPMNLVRRRVTGQDRGRVTRTTPGPVPWVVGACVVASRVAFEAVDGFDPRFFLYFEDVDLCVRLEDAGWETWLDPQSVIRHDHRGASRGSLMSSPARRHMASALRFYRKHPRFLLP